LAFRPYLLSYPLQLADIIVGMEQVLTLVCKIQPTEDERAHIDETMCAFANACTYIHATLPQRITNVMRMQAMLYDDVRGRFGLSSNLAQQAFRRVSANRKAAKVQGESVTTFDSTSIQYDQRIFSFIEHAWRVSLTLLYGRVHFRLHLGNYQRDKLKGQKPTSAQLCKHADDSYTIHIQIKTPVPPLKTPTDVLGVDLRRIDIAHSSDGNAWDGSALCQCRDHFARMRAALNRKASKGTRSTRRRCRQLLDRLSGRERRFQRRTNHGISKTLVEIAQTQQAALALEDLTGIRERTNQEPRPKTERRRSNSWAFFQLRQFVQYKAALAGVLLVLVPAAYTSQMCHTCLHMGARKGKRFACTNPACAWTGDADFNAAHNIRILGLNHLSQPRGPWLHCQLQGS
jgi:putative transposase